MAPEYLMNKLIMHNAVRSLRSDSMFKRLVVLVWEHMSPSKFSL